MARISERSVHRQSQVTSHGAGQVVILEAAGPLSDAVEDLDRATRLALAAEPRAVVCDLSRVVAPRTPGALRGLATTGRHPRDWPGVPVAVAGLAPHAGERLSRLPLGYHLVVSDSMSHALSCVLRAVCPTIRRQRLSPRRAAPSVARDFTGQTLCDWRLDHLNPVATLVVSELVSNAVTHARTDVVLSLAEHLGRLRLAVADTNPELPVPPGHGQTRGGGMMIVADHAKAWGVLPAQGGKVVWAVVGGLP